MTATNHVVMGALIATVVHNPWIAIPVALASHFVLDSIPHSEYTDDGFSPKFMYWLAADCGVAGAILMSLLLLQPAAVALMVACGIVAASPDLMWLYYLLIKKGQAKDKWPVVVKFHAKIQKYTSVRLWPVELAWFLITGGLLVTRLH